MISINKTRIRKTRQSKTLAMGKQVRNITCTCICITCTVTIEGTQWALTKAPTSFTTYDPRHVKNSRRATREAKEELQVRNLWRPERQAMFILKYESLEKWAYFKGISQQTSPVFCIEWRHVTNYYLIDRNTTEY